MHNFCEIVGIDGSFYNDYQFRIENKTRVVRFRNIHKMAEKINRKLEFIQNKFPALRQLIKTAYYRLLNPEARNSNIVDTSYAKTKLTGYYCPHNRKLKKLLETNYPGTTSLPGWLIDEQ